MVTKLPCRAAAAGREALGGGAGRTAALRPTGLLAVNAVDVAPLELARALAATLATVFAHVLVVADRDVLAHRSSGNVVLAASDAPLPAEPLRARAAGAADPEEVLAGAALGAFAAGGRVLRDGLRFDHRLARVTASGR